MSGRQNKEEINKIGDFVSTKREKKKEIINEQ